MFRTLKIGKKLGLAFGLLILLMAAGTLLAYLQQRRVDVLLGELQHELFPATVAADAMEASVHRSLAALRGYMILGAEPGAAAQFKEQRQAAWRGIDRARARLEALSPTLVRVGQKAGLVALEQNLEGFRQAQQRAENEAHSPTNIRAYHTLRTQAIPRASQMAAAITALLESEAEIAPTPERRQLIKALADTRGHTALALADIRAFLITGDPAFRERFSQRWLAGDAAVAAVNRQADLLTPDQKADWEVFGQLRTEFAPMPETMFSQRLAPDWNTAAHILATDAVPRSENISGAVEEIGAALASRVDLVRVEADSASARLTGSLLAQTGLGLVFGTAIALLFSRRVAAALGVVLGRAREIEGGDLTGEPIRHLAGDEVGELAEVFNGMQATLAAQIGQVRTGVENLNGGITEILASMQQQASSTEEQAATVQEVTSTMEELSQSGADIAGKAREVAAACEGGPALNAAGIGAVADTTRSIDSTCEQVEEVAEHIVALSEKMQAVGEITAAVGEVAEQSKLLALNAAIEAASAGDEGRRFAVVAAEMKGLADQAKASTTQVHALLGEVQKGINTSVMLTEEAVKRAGSGRAQAEVTQGSIEEMAAMIERSIQAFQQIVGGTNQQQIGYEQVTQGMQGIRQACEQTAAGTSQLESAAANLNSLSAELTALVSRYRV